jgi:hypothetical protein
MSARAVVAPYAARGAMSAAQSASERVRATVSIGLVRCAGVTADSER